MSRHATQHTIYRSGFAARLHEALDGRTSEDFARELNVTLRTVQRWRNGDGEPRGGQLVRLAAALDRDPAWFYAEPEPDEKAAA